MTNLNSVCYSLNYVWSPFYNLVIPPKSSKFLWSFNLKALICFQRCHEIEMLSKNSSLMGKVLPEDASCEEIEVIYHTLHNLQYPTINMCTRDLRYLATIP